MRSTTGGRGAVFCALERRYGDALRARTRGERFRELVAEDGCEDVGIARRRRSAQIGG